LQKDKHKGLLAVWFSHVTIPTCEGAGQKELGEFKKFVADLGYRRVLVLEGCLNGINIVYDSAYHTKDEDRSDR
jgi:hypothetical protein